MNYLNSYLVRSRLSRSSSRRSTGIGPDNYLSIDRLFLGHELVDHCLGPKAAHRDVFPAQWFLLLVPNSPKAPNVLFLLAQKTSSPAVTWFQELLSGYYAARFKF